MQTIYALSTILGRSGAAVIRISGPQSSVILRAFTGRDFQPRQATFCTFL